MDQRTRGLHSVLSAPQVYRAYQRAIGARHLHREVVSLLAPEPGDRLLDIGCGPADILDDLPDVDYVGFDLSARYIAYARRRYATRATFFVADVTEVDSDALGTFDLVLAHGILHHVSDEKAAKLFDLARRVLGPQGRLVTVDGCYHEGQRRLSRFFVSRDRGQMVRSIPEYRALAEGSFASVEVNLHHSLLRIPYSLAILRCSQPRSQPLGVHVAAETNDTPPTGEPAVR